MAFFANQKLAVRLGVAFGALAVGLLIVAVIGFGQMGSLRSTTADLSHNNLRAEALGGLVNSKSLDVGQETSNHLFVHDGDLKAQDGIQKDIAGLTAEGNAASAELAKLVKGTPAAAPYTAFAAAADRYFALDAKAIALSRKETQRGDAQRAGSRGLYTGDMADARDHLDDAGDALLASIGKEAGDAAAKAKAHADSARRNILVAALIPLLLAAALAVFVTRSVTRPVAALGVRLRSLDENCLAGLTGGLEAVAKGDLTHEVVPVTTPIEVSSTDELGRLSTTFNEALNKTQRSVVAYNEMRAELGSLIGKVSATA